MERERNGSMTSGANQGEAGGRPELGAGDAYVRAHRQDVPVIFESSRPGAEGYRLPPLDLPPRDLEEMIPSRLLRHKPPRLPEVTEPEVVRHYIRLSTLNHHVDRGLYPLGSCTMKYNPKINEELSGRPEFAGLHPLVPDEHCQGILELLFNFKQELARVVGMDDVSLHPAAGAQGEMLGIKLVRAYHQSRRNRKTTVIIPDSAHGTNPASVRMVGFEVQELRSRPDGRLDLGRLKEMVNAETAAIMVTNPNTLGVFESDFQEMAAILHRVDGLVYMDGANLNALIGLVRPGDIGADIVHINLHKTFSTPHGGGGPGSGPVGVKEKLVAFLPVPRVVHDPDGFRLLHRAEHSVGRLHPFLCNAGIVLRAYAYLRSLGSEGLSEVSRGAILNANYLAAQVAEDYPAAVPGPFMHEFVSSLSWMKKHGVRNIDAAKRLLDDGFHAPTVSFPLIVPDCFMIEPTETETRASLDSFAESLKRIAEEARTSPEVVTSAPHWTPVGRLDEAAAARNLKLRWEWQE
jgi:glycine dehydrogenase subunit 2